MGNLGEEKYSKQIIKRKLFYICVIACSMYIYYFFSPPDYQNPNPTLSDLRVQSSGAVSAAERSDFEYLEKYQCLIVDVESNVIYSNHHWYKEGDKINLHMLSTAQGENNSNNRFISPLVSGNVQIGTLMIEVDDSAVPVNRYHWIPGLLFLTLLFTYVIRFYGYIDCQIFTPINKLTSIVEAISNKEYQVKIEYNNKDELGRLLRKLDFLKDELQYSSRQAKKFQENEKILLACISHDLKTPISTIRGYAEGIRDHVVKEASDIERYIEVILSKAVLLTKLINDILEHSNAELDELSLKQIEVYSRRFIKDIFDELAADIKSVNISLLISEIPDVLLYIAPDRIFQVFQNIIGNSLKYTQKDGWIRVNFEVYEKFLAVEISDNGQGIAAIDIPFIFDRFYRGEKARTQKEIGGSGLGLSIVKNIIDRHGGRVECDSILGQGTTIRFLLPKA